MSFHVPKAVGGGWIVQTPTGVRLETGALPSCITAAERAAAKVACKKTQEQVRGFGAGFSFNAGASTSSGASARGSAGGGGSRLAPPARAKSEACQLAERPVCGKTKCLDLDALNRVLDNLRNKSRGAWALWGMSAEARAMQSLSACTKIAAPKCLNIEQQKLLDYYKKYGWKGPNAEMNGSVWVAQAQSPDFFKRPRCTVVLPSLPQRAAPKKTTVMLTPVVRRPPPPPPRRRVKKHPCSADLVLALKQEYAALLATAKKSRCLTPSEQVRLAKVSATLRQRCEQSMPRYGQPKTCAQETARIPPKLTPPLLTQQPKSPEAPAPILAPPTPAVVAPPLPPTAPAPSPEAPAPVLEPGVTTEPSSEVTEPVVAPELPATAEMEGKMPINWWLVALAAGGGYYLWKKSAKGKRA